MSSLDVQKTLNMKRVKQLLCLGGIIWATALVFSLFPLSINALSTMVTSIVFLLIMDMDYAWEMSGRQHYKKEKRSNAWGEVSIALVYTGVILVFAGMFKSTLSFLIFSALWIWLGSCLIVPFIAGKAYGKKTFSSWMSGILTTFTMVFVFSVCYFAASLGG